MHENVDPSRKPRASTAVAERAQLDPALACATGATLAPSPALAMRRPPALQRRRVEPAAEHPERARHAARSRTDRVLFERYHRTRDRRDRDEIVERFMPLARRLAGRYNRRGDSLEDLTQVAAMALVKAVDRFDPTRGLAFSSYAVPTIVGELKRHFRDHGWAVRPPRALAERALLVEAASGQFAAEHHRAPTIAELCGRLDGLGEEDVLDALHAGRAATAASLDAPRAGDDEDGTLAERFGSDDEGFHRAEQRALLDDLMRCVSPRERAILRMRFVEDMTQAEIGDVLGVSQMQISRLLRRALERMQTVSQAKAPPVPVA